MNFADSARDIRTKFVRICQIRTNFVPISYEFPTNSYEIRMKFVQISQIQAKKYRDEIPGFLFGAVWACWVRLGWDFTESWGLKMELNFCPPRHIEAKM